MVYRATLENTLENFSRNSDRDCILLVQDHLLEALQSETYFELELIGKLMSLSDPDRETFTKSLNAAIKKNQQQIAGLSIAAWLKKYLDAHNGVARTPNTFFEYCNRTSEIKRLPRPDQLKLMRLFRMYDYLFVEPIQDLEYPIENILRFSMQTDLTPAEISAQVQTAPAGFLASPAGGRPSQRTITEKLPLRDLLRKYPAVGEQLITGGQLKLAHFDRPVRPSIRNWIYDYTSQLGQERHDSMQRMKYLFSSLNGKNLSSPDREKLGIILKSFDENVPLPVDATRNEIVFSKVESEIPNSQFPIPNKTPNFKITKSAVAEQQIPKPQSQTFIKPYPRQEIKPQTPPRPISQSSTFPSRQQSSRDSSKSNFRFTNPYPAPETHKVASAEMEMAGEAPVKLKGFSEGVSKDTQSSASPASAKARLFPSGKQVAGIPQSRVLNEPPKPYAPSRPKNVIHPHYRPQREEKPEPRITGNVVDLSDQ